MILCLDNHSIIQYDTATLFTVIFLSSKRYMKHLDASLFAPKMQYSTSRTPSEVAMSHVIVIKLLYSGMNIDIKYHTEYSIWFGGVQ